MFVCVFCFFFEGGKPCTLAFCVLPVVFRLLLGTTSEDDSSLLFSHWCAWLRSIQVSTFPPTSTLLRLCSLPFFPGILDILSSRTLRLLLLLRSVFVRVWFGSWRGAAQSSFCVNADEHSSYWLIGFDVYVEAANALQLLQNCATLSDDLFSLRLVFCASFNKWISVRVLSNKNGNVADVRSFW